MPELRTGLVFSLGNPLLDIQATVDAAFLEKYGLKADNAILCSDDLVPLFAEMKDKYNPEFIAGGATENSCRVAQWVIGVPNVINFTGCIGNDEYGRILQENVKSVGVNPHFQFHPTMKTGTCAVCITGHKRSLCAHLAAANCFEKDHLLKLWNHVEAADYFYIASFVLTVSPDSVVAIGEHAAEKDKYFMMNLSAPFLVSVFKEPMMRAFPFVDLIFGNETEAAEFAKEHNFGTTDAAEIALKMAAMPKKNEKKPRIAIITQGSEAVVVAKDGKSQTFPVPKMTAEQIVDTNGAGDAFVGGFIAQFIKGKSLEESIKCGVWAAQTIIKHSGCAYPPKCDYKE